MDWPDRRFTPWRIMDNELDGYPARVILYWVFGRTRAESNWDSLAITVKDGMIPTFSTTGTGPASIEMESQVNALRSARRQDPDNIGLLIESRFLLEALPLC